MSKIRSLNLKQKYNSAGWSLKIDNCFAVKAAFKNSLRTGCENFQCISLVGHIEPMGKDSYAYDLRAVKL